VVGGVLLLITALGVVVQLKDALNTIFEVEEPQGAGFAWYARVTTVACAGIHALGLPSRWCLVPCCVCVLDEFDGSKRAV
jgi:uncharacterized BrkB/YihY/UPF0761 family membrane protein